MYECVNCKTLYPKYYTACPSCECISRSEHLVVDNDKLKLDDNSQFVVVSVFDGNDE